MVFLNENATIFCKIPGFPHLDINSMGITWFRKAQVSETEIKLFEFFGDHKVAFRPGANVSPWRLKRGDASLQLPGVQLWEAGEYRCELVVTPQKAQGRVWLEVVGECLRAVPCDSHGDGARGGDVDGPSGAEHGPRSQIDVGLSPGLPWTSRQLWTSY